MAIVIQPPHTSLPYLQDCFPKLAYLHSNTALERNNNLLSAINIFPALITHGQSLFYCFVCVFFFGTRLQKRL